MPMLYISKERIYAVPNCHIIEKRVYFQLLSSRCIVDVAATQGTYSRTNTRNAYAATGVAKVPLRAPATTLLEAVSEKT